MLETLYESTGGADWSTLQEKWLSEDICGYSRIVCDTFGKLSAIELSGSGLVGELPSELGELPSLNLLNVSHNEGLVGSLPSTFGGLSLLRVLSLDNTQLNGTLPTQIGNLEHLQLLELSAVQLMSGTIPTQLGRAGWSSAIDPTRRSLTKLTLSGSLSGTIPSELGLLSVLSVLDAFSTRLSGSLPRHLGVAPFGSFATCRLPATVICNPAVPSCTGCTATSPPPPPPSEPPAEPPPPPPPSLPAPPTGMHCDPDCSVLDVTAGLARASGRYNRTGEFNGLPRFESPNGFVLRYELLIAGSSNSGRSYELYAELNSGVAETSGLVASSEMSCRESEYVAGQWNDLRAALHEDDCKQRCTATPSCFFVTWRPSTHHCTAFVSCTLTVLHPPLGRKGDKIFKAVSNWSMDLRQSYGAGDGWFFHNGDGELIYGIVTPAGVQELKRLTEWMHRGEGVGTIDDIQCVAPTCHMESKAALRTALEEWNEAARTDPDSLRRNRHPENVPGSLIAKYGFPSNFQTQHLTDFSSLFQGLNYFNDEIASWDVSAVTSMAMVFDGAERFNQDINSWVTDSVSDMSGMFRGAKSFDLPLNRFATQSVTNFDSMFEGCSKFNQPLGSWNTRESTSLRRTFASTSEFDQDLNTWDVAHVTAMDNLFLAARAFDGTVASWDVGAVTSMVATFREAVRFNSPLNAWNPANVTSMAELFMAPLAESPTSVFNQPLNAWNVDAVTSMHRMFHFHVSFNQPLPNWKVSRVTNFSEMWSIYGWSALSNCNRHLLSKQWWHNPHWFASEYGKWHIDYACESPPPLPPPSPPTPPPATPDWSTAGFGFWSCSVHLWADDARRRARPDRRPHSGMDYQRAHYEAELVHDNLADGERNLPTVISGCCQCYCTPANTPDSKGRSCKVPNRPDGSPPSAGLIVNPPETCRCPMCDKCNNITWTKEFAFCGHETLNRGRWVRLTAGETCETPGLGTAARRLSIDGKDEL